MKYAGEEILVKASIKIDGVLDDPATVKVSITKGSPNGSVIVSPTDMTNKSLGIFEYVWDSTDQNAGIYYAKVHGTDDAPGNWEFIKIALS